MKFTRLIAVILSICLLLSGCGSSGEAQSGDTILATTYPMYYLTQRLLDGVENVHVEALITEEVSCLHDYTITTTQMRRIEEAELLVLSGAGLEHFMESALDSVPEEKLIDSSEGVALLGEDPHIWLDPERYAQQGENIAAALVEAYPAEKHIIETNAQTLRQELLEFKSEMNTKLQAGVENPNIITFHDGFAYFADAFGLTILAAIEEEEGAEPSAAELKEVCELVEAYGLKAIFTEVNGVTNAAEIISGETGVGIRSLSMVMSDGGLDYFGAMEQNIQAILTEGEKTE